MEHALFRRVRDGYCLVRDVVVLPGWSPTTLVLLLCTLGVCGVGLVDDVRTLSPSARVIVEAVAASIVLLSAPEIQLGHGAAYWALTVAWVVLLTNSFNLLDNMDGCAGVVALVTAVGLATGAGLEDNEIVGSLAGIIAGSCAGFLLFNWPPARLFMGDAGSLSARISVSNPRAERSEVVTR